MFEKIINCYGDSNISFGCKKCVFDRQIDNGHRCEKCIRNEEISESLRENDKWIDDSKFWDYFDLRG